MCNIYPDLSTHVCPFNHSISQVVCAKSLARHARPVYVLFWYDHLCGSPKAAARPVTKQVRCKWPTLEFDHLLRAFANHLDDTLHTINASNLIGSRHGMHVMSPRGESNPLILFKVPSFSQLRSTIKTDEDEQHEHRQHIAHKIATLIPNGSAIRSCII